MSLVFEIKNQLSAQRILWILWKHYLQRLCQRIQKDKGFPWQQQRWARQDLPSLWQQARVASWPLTPKEWAKCFGDLDCPRVNVTRWSGARHCRERPAARQRHQVNQGRRNPPGPLEEGLNGPSWIEIRPGIAVNFVGSDEAEAGEDGHRFCN